MRQTFFFIQPSIFPQLSYVGFVGIVFSIVQAVLGDYPQAGFALAISLIILLSRSWIRLDVQAKRLIYFFLFIPYKTVKLDAIHGFILTEGVVSQTLSLRGSSSDIRFYLYKILLDTGDERLVLAESRNQEKMRRRAEIIAKAAGAPMEDRTT